MDNNAVTSLFLFFVSTTFIIIAAYYATRFIGQKAAGFSQKKNVSLLEKSILPGNLSIEVVKVADHVYVLACRGKDVTLLDQYTMNHWLEMKTIDKPVQYDMPIEQTPNPFQNGINILRKKFITGYEKKD